MKFQISIIEFQVSSIEKIVDLFSGILKFKILALVPDFKVVFIVNDVKLVFFQNQISTFCKLEIEIDDIEKYHLVLNKQYPIEIDLLQKKIIHINNFENIDIKFVEKK